MLQFYDLISDKLVRIPVEIFDFAETKAFDIITIHTIDGKRYETYAVLGGQEI